MRGKRPSDQHAEGGLLLWGAMHYPAPETEWVETVETGWNVVAGADILAIVEGYRTAINSPPKDRLDLYGDGKAARHILHHLIK